MTPRSIRRAAERKRTKLEKKKQAALAMPTQHDESAADTPELDAAPSISQAQLSANRANRLDEAAPLSEPKTQERSSTGPRSLAGKANSSLNAVKTALTGRTVLLPSDDAAAYQQHLEAYEKRFQPVDQVERDLVQSIADTQWRLNRIPSLEMAIYAKGRLELADAFEDYAPSLRAGMIDLEIAAKYEKQLRNLQLQDSRLARRREKEMAELRRLQQPRHKDENARRAKALEFAAERRVAADLNGLPAPLTPVDGFEFSKDEIADYILGRPDSWMERVMEQSCSEMALESAEDEAQAA